MRQATRILLACACWLTSSDLAQAEPKRAPVPDQAAVIESKKLVAEVYRAEYTAAKTVQQKKALIEKLLSDAEKSGADLPGKYALLMVAWDMAGGAGDWEASFKAVEKLGHAFELDTWDLTDAARAKIEQADKPAQDPKAALLLVMGAIQGAIAKDRYDVAERLAASAKKLVRRVNDPQLAKQFTEQIPDLQKLKRQYDEVKESLATLKESPADPAANLAVGRFRCFVQGRWDEGVPMLALGSDSALAAAAEKEVRQPTTAAEMLAVADAWWSLAETNKEDQSALRRHAVDRYLRVYPQLEGLPKKKAETRITESERWLSKDAVYRVSQFAKGEPPLASLLNATERFYGDPNYEYAFQIEGAEGHIVIDLHREVPISRIYIRNRPVKERNRGMGVYLSTSPDRRGDLVWTAPDDAPEWTITLPKLHTARYITIARDPNRGDAWFNLRKVKVFGPE